MNGMILEQSTIFLYALILGSMALFTYDLIRVLRRLVTHSTVIINLEDFIYFIILGFISFVFIKQYNAGEIRGYIILALALGAIVYYLLLSGFIVKYLTAIILFVVKPIIKVIYYITLPLRKIVQFLNNIWEIAKKYLKKIMKWSIMKIAKCFRELKNIVKYY